MIGALPKGRCNRELFRNMPARLAMALPQEAAAASQFHIPAEPHTGGEAVCLLGGMGSLDRAIGGLAAPSKNSGTLTARTAATNIATSFCRFGLAAWNDGPWTRRSEGDGAGPIPFSGGAARPVMPAGWAGIARWRVGVTGSTRRRSRCFHRSVRFRPGGSGSGCLSRRRVCWFRSSHFRTGGNPGGPSAFASSPDPGRSCLG